MQEQLPQKRWIQPCQGEQTGHYLDRAKNGITRIARCDRLWKHKSSKATGEEQHQDETDCMMDKTEEELKDRQHQYMEDPEMRVRTSRWY